MFPDVPSLRILLADELVSELLEPDELELDGNVISEPDKALELLGVAISGGVVAVELSAVDEPATDPDDPDPELEPEPPKQPVGTPKQLNCGVPQNCPNLQDYVFSR